MEPFDASLSKVNLDSRHLKLESDSGMGADFARMLADYQASATAANTAVAGQGMPAYAAQLLTDLEKVSQHAIKTTVLATTSASATGAVKKLMSGS